jgi:hypothetical protein
MMDKKVVHIPGSRLLSGRGRWFGVVKRKNGKFFYGYDLVRECPTQDIFIANKLKPDKGDVVVEVFKNSLLEPEDFKSYYREFYLGEAPMFVPLDHVTKSV